MKLFVSLLFALLLSFPAHAGGRVDCGERCQFQKHASGTGLKPAVPNEVCFWFTQTRPGFVTLTLYDAYFGSNDPRNRVLRQIKHQKPDGLVGKHCVGSQWVKQSVFADECNDVNHSDRGIPSLSKGLQTGVVQMCLLGEKCSRFVK